MELIRCAQGHQWESSGQETMAMCPVCGGAPMPLEIDKSAPSSQDQTLGDDAFDKPPSPDQGTIALSMGDVEGFSPQPSLARPASEELTLGGNEDDEPRTEFQEPTIGLPGAADEGDPPQASMTEQHTIGLDDSGSAVKVDRTLGSSGEAGDHTIDLPREATRHEVKVEQTIGLDDGPVDDHTLGMPAAPSGTFKIAKEEDKTGAWDLPEAALPPTHAQGPGGTIVDGGIRSTPKPAESTAKSGNKKKKKDPLAGKTKVAGYEILGELGRGGMGVVYKARQPGAKRVVALKMVLGSGHAGKEALMRFKIEAEAVALLQHPNIVQLYEVGEEDGCPFFSLEYIDGDSLSRKIEGKPQPPKQAAQLVQQLADAMHLAHQRGIIHRDLKPANILLTKDGIPKITDFGLAKRFEDKGEGYTRTGAIMGTPSYMAPEQAQGHTKNTGPPADIYSLGALLYDMLTGRPPFRGSTLLETLQQVQTAEPVPPMRLQPTTPYDLQTICLKALEKDPLKRYRTAGDLAEDLRRFQAGEPIAARPTTFLERGWKWTKRRPALASLILVSILGFFTLLTMGGLWLDAKRQAAEIDARAAEDRASKQKQLTQQAEALADLERKRKNEAVEQAKKEEALRKIAQKNFRRAKAAVDQMLSEVGQDQLRYIPQMETVRRDLLAKAKKFYDEFMQEQISDPDIRWESALAQQRVADIMEMLGDTTGAQTAYVSALGLFQNLEKEYPNQTQYKIDLAKLASNYGNLLKDLKRNVEAEKSYRRALELRAALYDKSSNDANLALDLAKSHNNLALVLQLMGQTKKAAGEYQAGRLLLDRLIVNPGGPVYEAELARTLNNLGTMQKGLGPAGAAEASLLEANRILNGLVAKEPHNPSYRQDLAENHYKLAETLRDSDSKKAEAHYRQSIAESSKLTKDFASVPVYQQDLARGYSGLAILLQALSRQDESDAAYDLALALQQKIVDRYPNLPDFRRNLALGHNARGVMLLSTNRLKEGESALMKAKGLFSALTKEHQDNPEYAEGLADTYLNLGTVFLQTNQPAKAQDYVRQSLAVREKLAKKLPDEPLYQEELASTEGNLGLLLLAKHPDEAKALFSNSVKTFKRLADAQPKNSDVRHQLADGYFNLGDAQRLLGRPKEAEEDWHRAIVLYKGLIGDRPDVPSYAVELGRRLNELGIFLVGAKRFPDAEQAWRDGIAVQKQLLTRFPDQPEYRLKLGRSLGNLGIMFVQSGNLDKAEKQYRQGIALLEEYEPKVTATAVLPAYLGELIKIHLNLANLLNVTSRPAEAEKSWLRLVDLREKLVKNFPEARNYRLEAVAILNELGNRLVQNQKYAEAKDFFGKAVDHLRALTKGSKVAPEMWTNLYLMELNLATSLVGLKDHAGAYKVISELPAEAPVVSRQDQAAAALLARCVPLAGADKQLAKTYAEQAMTLLRHAVDNGFRNVEFVANNNDFQALREREDFKGLVTRLQKN